MVPFLFDVGQRNAVFIERSLVPLAKLHRSADAFAPLPEPGYDIIHSLNAVPLLTRRPYLITFEDYLPRVPEDRYVGWLEDWLREKLLSSQCVRLIAISEYARRQFRWQNRHFDRLADLERKLQVIYPVFRLKRTTPKRPSGRLKLLFVGGDFLRKGGPAVVRSHERLRKEGIPVETIVVSRLAPPSSDYVAPLSLAYAQQEFGRLNQPGITVHKVLPHGQVMELMEEADYLVFPTLHDTFGFVSLEALSCGTPVIASRTCVQPEIIEDGRCGFLLPMDNDEQVGKWKWLYRNKDPEYLDAYRQTIEGLSRALSDRLMQHWTSGQKEYTRLSEGALERMRTRFNPEKARESLEQLYELCGSMGPSRRRKS